MKLIEQRFLRGPNMYAATPCMVSVVALGELQGAEPPAVAGFGEHTHSNGHEGVAGLLKRLVLDLQGRAGSDVSLGFVHPDPDNASQAVVVCAYKSERVAARAFALAMDLVQAAVAEVPFDLDEALASLRRLGARSAMGTSTGAVIRAALRRTIPVLRITEGANLFQLGWGSKQQRLQATITGATSHIGVGIASDKQLTKALLAQAGLPVPAGETVSSADDAWRVVQALQGPATIKPLDANQGKGVSTICISREEVDAAFEHARHFSRHVIVERYLSGRDYRVLVTGGRVAAAAWRRPPAVRGDGVATIRALVELENRNPARGDGHSNILTRIALDDHALTLLRKQGYGVDDVLPAGVSVELRGNANLSTGGTAEDVTDKLPAETALACIRAARAIGLDIAGIDIICDDIAHPLAAQGGGIIEVNAAPGIRMHEFPSRGQPRDAGDAIVEALFGPGDGRIPLIAVAGRAAASTSTATRLIAHAVQLSGVASGMATSHGVYIGEQLALRGNCANHHGARMVLSDPTVALAVLETSHASIMQDGLAFDRCDVAVLLDADQTAGAEAARTAHVLARTARVTLVLNVADAACVSLAYQLRQHVEIVYFSMDADHPALLRHMADGGRAVYLHDHTLVLATGTRHQGLLDVRTMPLALQGGARDDGAAVAAAAALISHGLSVEQTVAGLQSYVMSSDVITHAASLMAGSQSECS